MLIATSAIVSEQNLLVLRNTQTSAGLASWIQTDNYNVSFSDDDVELSPYDPASLASCLSNDCLRLLFAGRETLEAIRAARQANALHPAWSAIQMYYAAFYYSSALLRTLGISQSFLQLSEVQRLRSILTAQGGANLPGTGLYLFTLNSRCTSAEFGRASEKGTHEALWKHLRGYIDGLKTRIPAYTQFTEVEIASASEQLDLLSYASKGLAPQPNLSSTRNDVQYRQKLSCWHPNARAVRQFHDTDRINRALSEAFNPLTTINDVREYDDFFTRSLLICAFVHQIIISDSSSNPSNSISGKYLRYHNSLAPAMAA